MESADILNSQSSTQTMKETQEMLDSQILDQSTIDDNVWGRLLATRKSCQVYNLIDSEHSFGRGDADHRFTTQLFDKKLLPVMSKIHFVISRIPKGTEDYVIEIEDRSSNGTFVNGTLVGPYKKRFLRNNDVISLAAPKSKVFSFHDCVKNDAKNYPDELNKNYIIMKKIGDGAYGEVRLAYAEESHTPAAVKIIKRRSYSEGGNHLLQDNNIGQIENETDLLRSVDHPCIVKLLDIIDSKDYIYIVMEYAEGGELFDKILSVGRLSEATAKFYFYQLVHAIAYLHDKKITHRDIKPENILLATDDELTTIKLTDFGLSKLSVSVMTTFCGTVMYIAPEMLAADNRQYTNKADMWSLGVVLYVCLLGSLPFSGKTDKEKSANIWKGKYMTNDPMWQNLSASAQSLVEKLLVVDPNKRLSAEEALQHEWLKDKSTITKVKKLFKSHKMSDLSPLKRPREVDHTALDDNIVEKTPKLMSGVEFNHNSM